MKNLAQDLIFPASHQFFPRRGVIVIAQQMQHTVNNQALQLFAQTRAVAPGVIFSHWNANRHRSETAAWHRAEIECDHISDRGIPQKSFMQSTNCFLIDKIYFEAGCPHDRSVLPPK